MTPYKYSIKNGLTVFHYRYSELKEFVTRGKQFGDCGMILVKRKENMLVNKGYGTIENPNKSLLTFVQIHHEGFFGKLPTNDEIINPPESRNTWEMRFVILNMDIEPPEKK